MGSPISGASVQGPAMPNLAPSPNDEEFLGGRQGSVQSNMIEHKFSDRRCLLVEATYQASTEQCQHNEHSGQSSLVASV